MTVQISLIVIAVLLFGIAVLLFAICVLQSAEHTRAQTERQTKFAYELQAHEADAASWERTAEAREARMDAWDATSEGERLYHLEDGLSYVGKPDAGGTYWLSFPDADLPYPVTERELAEMRVEVARLIAKRHSVWAQAIADYPLPTVTKHPHLSVRYPSPQEANSYFRRYGKCEDTARAGAA